MIAALLDPKVWIALAIAIAASFAGGYAYRMSDSVSTERYTDVVKANAILTAQLGADTKTFNDIARVAREGKADDERAKAALRTQVAEGAVLARTLEAQRDHESQRAAHLLDAYGRVVRSVSLPGLVRDGYNAAVGDPGRGTDAGPRPDPAAVSGQGSAPIDSAEYAKRCTADVTAWNRTADLYDDLYSYTQQLHARCARQGAPQ